MIVEVVIHVARTGKVRHGGSKVEGGIRRSVTDAGRRVGVREEPYADEGRCPLHGVDAAACGVEVVAVALGGLGFDDAAAG